MHHLRPGALPIAARHALGQAASSGDWASPESAPANRRAVKTVSAKAATSVETTVVEAVEARRHNGCKHSKCHSGRQRDCDFTEHD
jgi:hypothetical protein